MRALLLVLPGRADGVCRGAVVPRRDATRRHLAVLPFRPDGKAGRGRRGLQRVHGRERDRRRPARSGHTARDRLRDRLRRPDGGGRRREHGTGGTRGDGAGNRPRRHRDLGRARGPTGRRRAGHRVRSGGGPTRRCPALRRHAHRRPDGGRRGCPGAGGHGWHRSRLRLRGGRNRRPRVDLSRRHPPSGHDGGRGRRRVNGDHRVPPGAARHAGQAHHRDTAGRLPPAAGHPNAARRLAGGPT